MREDIKSYFEGIVLSFIFMILLTGLFLLNIGLMLFPKINLILPNMFLRAKEDSDTFEEIIINDEH